MTYDDLLNMAYSAGLIVRAMPLYGGYKARIKGNRIAIEQSLTTTEKACVLAEELGHYYTTIGDILDQSNPDNRRQEYRARLYGYDLMVGLGGIVRAYRAGCTDLDSMADYLGVTVQYLTEALACYRQKHGVSAAYYGYVIFFAPSLAVYYPMGEGR